MDKILVVIEEALEGSGYSVEEVTPDRPADVRLRELFITGTGPDGREQEFIVTVERG